MSRGLCRADAFVGQAVLPGVFPLQARKMPIQGLIKILPAAFPQGNAHVPAEYALNARIEAEFQQAPEVFLRVVQKGQNGRNPRHGFNARAGHLLQRPGPPPGATDAGFQNFAQFFVAGGQGHLSHALALPGDALKQIQIFQYPVGFGLNAQPEAPPGNDFVAPAGKAALGFQREIRVAHGPGMNHAPALFSAQGPVQQFRGVFLHGHVFKGMIHAVADAAAVALNAAVSAATVNIHAVKRR